MAASLFASVLEPAALGKSLPPGLTEEQKQDFEYFFKTHESDFRSAAHFVLKTRGLRTHDFDMNESLFWEAAMKTFFKFDPEIQSRPRALFQTIYSRLLIDQHRRNKLPRAAPFDDHSFHLSAPPRTSMDVSVLKKIDLTKVKYFDLLMLNLRGMTYEQIASLKDLPLGTVKSQIARCKVKLKQLVSSQGLRSNKKTSSSFPSTSRP